MSSTPNSTATYQAEVNEFTPPRRGWSILWSVLFAGALLTFLVLVGKTEIARWHYAATRNALEDGRFEDAVQSAERGLYWNPGYVDLILLRATARYELGDFAACLEDYDQALRIAAADEVENELDVLPKSSKAQVLHRMGRYQQALDLMDEVVDYRKEAYRLRDDAESQYQYSMALNNRAYSEAQAFTRDVPVDLGKSLEDTELAIELSGLDEPFLIDTLGYVQLLHGMPEKALENLNLAVRRTASSNEVRRKQILERMQTAADQRPYQQMLEELDQQYSIILHHRGEAHAALGNDELAKADLEDARKLGYNPEQGIW